MVTFSRGTNNYKVEASVDNNNWSTITETRFETQNSENPERKTVYPSPEVRCRYIRFKAIDYYGASAGLTQFVANSESACSLNDF